jgi:hypothetical protein
MTMGHYLRSMGTLAKQFTPTSFRDPQRQRLYLKDIDAPDAWAEHLKDALPETIFYLNECIEPRTGGDGAIREPNEYGQMRFGRGAATAGDLMSSLPPDMRALNMMCYIGHEGTYTPAHREMCASLGHNIMVETSGNEHGEKAGSSIWFMTETKEREVVSEYFLSMLGHDIEVENHFAQINAWKKAPFNVWVVEQKLGDLILVPPLAPHQVWNRGTRTMKAAWNRTTVDTLELAIHEALPRARMVCRDEQYKNKAIVYFTLTKYYGLLQRPTIEEKMWKYGRIKQLLDAFKRLFALFTEILIGEMFSPSLPTEENVEFLPFDSHITCSYCRCNIFNRFLTCKSCTETAPTGDEDAYDICMECYAMGRSCACISNLTWVEQWDWSVLTGNYELWRGTVVDADVGFDYETSPLPLGLAKDRYGKKSVAQICQEQLKIRPWHDITKPIVHESFPGDSDVEPEVDDEGRLKKKTPLKRGKGRVAPVKHKTHPCHICMHHDWNWRLAFCTTCNTAYCYGVLWRAFDLMPQEVMEKEDWQCPKCLKMCSCGKCRRTPTQTPYAPRGTLLGHDTRQVADLRSVESLVDFSKTNLGWLRGENDGNSIESARMKKLKEKAEVEKARPDIFDESYLIDGSQQASLDSAPGEDGGQFDNIEEIDPLLGGPESSLTTHGDSHGFYQSPCVAADSTATANAIGYSTFDGVLDSIDGHYGSRQSTTYPSKLPKQIAPLHPFDASYPDPFHLSNNRMMGIGYYQQDNGVDKILYDIPNSNETSENSNLPLSQNPNLALSDLIGSLGETSKKRGQLGQDDAESGKKLFAPKRQKKLAKAKKLSAASKPESVVDNATSKPRGRGRPPRHSTGNPQSYADLGEDAVPEPDLNPELPLARKQGADWEDDLEFDDLELTVQAMSHFTKAPAKKALKWRVSEDDPNVRVAETADSEDEEKPAPKRRGRPAKLPKAIATATARARSPIPLLPVIRSSTPEDARPARIPKLFSLKEKLALKGKSFKIVAAKSYKPISSSSGPPSARSLLVQPISSESLKSPSGTPSVRSTPSVVVRPIIKSSPTVSSRNASVIDDILEQAEPSPAYSFAEAQSMTQSKLKDGKCTSIAPRPAEPFRKGPTVVRLTSSEPEFESEESDVSMSNLSSDDDDSSIPEMRPPPGHCGVSGGRNGMSNGKAIRG